MSNIVSSASATDAPQIDGRFWVTETHVDGRGFTHTQQWLAEPGADLSGALAVHAQHLSDSLRDQEIGANLAGMQALGSEAFVRNWYSTVGENVAAVKAAAEGMTIDQSMSLAEYLRAQPDYVLTGPFVMSAAQVADLRALPSVDALQAAFAAVAA